MKNEKLIKISSKKAFTMIELVFVIVVVGILASVAIPRLAASRDDAEITKARVMVASIRNALSMERQRRILRGDFNVIVSVGGDNTGAFGNFDDNSSQATVLEYAESNSTASGHWSVSGTGATTEYTFHQNAMVDPIFVVTNGRFVCKVASNCSPLLD